MKHLKSNQLLLQVIRTETLDNIDQLIKKLIDEELKRTWYTWLS